MGTNAAIPLSYQSPQIENPLQAYSLAQGIRNAQQEYQLRQQLGPEQLKSAQLANQQAQMQADAVAAINKAYQEGYGAQQANPEPTPTPATPSPATPAPANSMASALGGSPAPAPPVQASAANRDLTAATAPSAPAPAAAPSGNLSPAPGHTLPAFDFNRVIQSLAQSGQGHLIPGQMQSHIEMMTKQSQLLKDQLGNHSALAQEAAKLLQGIHDNPALDDAGKEAAYQQIRPQVANLERQMGADPSQLPPHYDEGTVLRMMGNASTVADWNNRQHQVADLAARVHEQLPKTVAEAQSQVYHDYGQAETPQQAADVVAKYQALASEEKRRDPNGTSVYAAALKNIPAAWTPDASLQAQLEPLKPEEKVKFFQSRLELTAQKLGAAATQGRDAYAAQLARTDPTEAALFPPAPPAGAKFDAQTVARTANQVGMTGAQRVTAENAMQYREELLDIKRWLGSMTQQKVDQGQQRLNNSPGALKQQINRWAEQAVQNSGGESFEDAIRDVRNPKNYINPDTNAPGLADHREEVAQQIETWQKGGLRKDLLKHQVDLSGMSADDKKYASDVFKSINLTGPGKSAAPAKPAAPPPAAKPVAAAKPQNAPAGKVLVYDGNGNPHSFDSEAQASNFETLVKNAGGSSSRNPSR